MKSAIIGCGSIAAVHAKTIAGMDGCKLAAVADVIPERAESMAREYGAVPYKDWKTMLDKEEIDVLHICTPHYLHTPMAVEALGRGIHTFMEKPPVICREQWETLVRAEREAKGRAALGICFQNRFNPSIAAVKEQLDRGAFGKILGARGFVTWCRKESYYTESDWRGTVRKEGGGALINQSIHTLDLIQYLIGKKPLAMEASTSNHHLKGVIEVEDTMEAYISYGEEIACFYATTGYAADVPPLIELECEKARVRIEDLRVAITGKDGEIRHTDYSGRETLGKSYWGSGHMDCIHSFYESVERETPFPVGLEQIRDTVWLMLRAYETAAEKERGEKC